MEVITASTAVLATPVLAALTTTCGMIHAHLKEPAEIQLTSGKGQTVRQKMELINADEVIRDLASLKYSKEYGKVGETYNLAIDDCIEEIKSTPTLDAKPIVYAHWIERRANNGNVHYTCSCCGKEVSYPYAKKRWKYCIECGAKMDEEKENNHE